MTAKEDQRHQRQISICHRIRAEAIKERDETDFFIFRWPPFKSNRSEGSLKILWFRSQWGDSGTDLARSNQNHSMTFVVPMFVVHCILSYVCPTAGSTLQETLPPAAAVRTTRSPGRSGSAPRQWIPEATIGHWPQSAATTPLKQSQRYWTIFKVCRNVCPCCPLACLRPPSAGLAR